MNSSEYEEYDLIRFKDRLITRAFNLKNKMKHNFHAFTFCEF